MKNFLKFSLIISILASYGCGQTGPLYLPKHPTINKITKQKPKHETQVQINHN